jgi:aspartyl-tRNA(Asn)/glutamyl-tRNA(Gln) amidotransferase subunit A
MKPTYGRVSRYGLIAFASSLDQIGPFGRNAADTALLLRAIAGPDPRDATCAPSPVPDYAAACRRDVIGLRIGVPREYLPNDLNPEIREAVERSLEGFRSLGARVEEVTLPHTAAAIPTYYLVATSEASSNLARYDGVRYGHRTQAPEDLAALYARTRREGFGAEVKRRIALGTFALSAGYYDAYYLKALKVRRLLRRDFDEALATVDVLAGPTSPIPPFRLGEKVQNPLDMYLCDVLTAALNLAGLPGVSVPCGFTKAGLPIGLQLIGRSFDEETLLRAAAALERTADHHTKAPPE